MVAVELIENTPDPRALCARTNMLMLYAMVVTVKKGGNEHSFSVQSNPMLQSLFTCSATTLGQTSIYEL